MRRAILAIALASARIARADDVTAEHAFHELETRAAAGDAHAIDAFEAMGARRPATRWTDDAWSEAARLAERAGDYDRARRDLEQVLAVATDDALARRARAELARIASFAGDRGEWSAVAATHERLVGEIQRSGGDPKLALTELGALVLANPGYPRAATAMLALASGWERDGNTEQARVWLDRAAAAARGGERERVTAERARFAMRYDDLDTAQDLVGRLTSTEAGELRAELDRARSRHTTRWILWTLLVLSGAAAIASLRRDTGSWRDAARRLVRPPAEALFFVPIAIVLVVIAWTGNPLVARAVRSIVLGGAAIAWISGACLEAARRRRGAIGLRRAILHASIAAVAVASASYLALGRGSMLDLVAETWRAGPGH